jgi:hypothetical protein
MLKIIVQIVLVLLFYLVLTPLGVILRLLKVDLINQHIVPSAKTYWEKHLPSSGAALKITPHHDAPK